MCGRAFRDGSANELKFKSVGSDHQASASKGQPSDPVAKLYELDDRLLGASLPKRVSGRLDAWEFALDLFAMHFLAVLFWGRRAGSCRTQTVG